MHSHLRLDGLRVVMLSWRDTTNPEGGGAEIYLDHVARGLVERGARVSVFCAAHDQAPAREVIAGVTWVRRGSKLSVYLWGWFLLLTRRLGRPSVVVDVQNGLPFFTRLATRAPVVVLVHHVHREQWPVVYPGVTGRIGWWIESRVAPRLYRRCQYVAVSRATRRELGTLGVDPTRIAVVHNGTAPELDLVEERTAHPSICVVGRLVPHKQVEHAVDAVVRLRRTLPALRLTIVGSGWWEQPLRDYAVAAGVGDLVEFTGQVSEEQKQRIYARSWVMALPSLKEGWGLVVGEAGRHGTPTVAYTSAGGTRESIEHRVSGLLAEDFDQLVEYLREVLTSPEQRGALSEGAREISSRFTWEHTHGSFASVLASAVRGQRVSVQDPDEDQMSSAEVDDHWVEP